MDFKTLVAENIGSAGIGAAVLAILYKVWNILKTDRKEDNLSEAERQFRDESRKDLKELREHNKRLEDEKHTCEEQISNLLARIRWLETFFSFCKSNHPAECPLLKHLGPEEFSKLGSRVCNVNRLENSQ